MHAHAHARVCVYERFFHARMASEHKKPSYPANTLDTHLGGVKLLDNADGLLVRPDRSIKIHRLPVSKPILSDSSITPHACLRRDQSPAGDTAILMDPLESLVSDTKANLWSLDLISHACILRDQSAAQGTARLHRKHSWTQAPFRQSLQARSFV